jgi:hypothetical protein
MIPLLPLNSSDNSIPLGGVSLVRESGRERRYLYTESSKVSSYMMVVFFARLSGPEPLNALLGEIERLRSEPIGEHTPSPQAVDAATSLIKGAAKLLQSAPPEGELDYYFGELGIEWRQGNRILRLTCFSGSEAPRLDYGTMSRKTSGEYSSDAVANAQILADRLDWLSGGTPEGYAAAL